MSSKLTPEQATRLWVDRVVVGLNLCPFAAPVIKNDGLYVEACYAQEPEALLRAVLEQLDKLQRSDESDIATSLLVFADALEDFDQYWAFVEVASELLQAAGLEGVIQIASFHPNYCFEGVAEDDVSHYSNRSPWPMLHFIREAQLSRALAGYPNPEQIPDNNIRRLRALGKSELLNLLAAD